MPSLPFKRIVPGGQISASEMNRALAAQEAAMRLPSGGPGAAALSLAGGSDVVPVVNKILIEITGGSNPYSWNQIIHEPPDPALVGTSQEGIPTPVEVEGMLGSLSLGLPAIEVRGNTTVPSGTIVEAWSDPASSCLFFFYPTSTGGGSAAFSGARVYRENNLTVSHDTVMPIEFTHETFDTDNYHSTSTNTERLTPPSAGYYLIGASVLWQINGFQNSVHQLAIRRNNPSQTLSSGSVNIKGLGVGLGNFAVPPVVTAARLETGEFLTVEVIHRDGLVNLILGGESACYAWITKLG